MGAFVHEFIILPLMMVRGVHLHAQLKIHFSFTQLLKDPLTIIRHLETRGRLMIRNLTQLEVKNIFLSVICIEKD